MPRCSSATVVSSSTNDFRPLRRVGTAPVLVAAPENVLVISNADPPMAVRRRKSLRFINGFRCVRFPEGKESRVLFNSNGVGSAQSVRVHRRLWLHDRPPGGTLAHTYNRRTYETLSHMRQSFVLAQPVDLSRIQGTPHQVNAAWARGSARESSARQVRDRNRGGDPFRCRQWPAPSAGKSRNGCLPIPRGCGRTSPARRRLA